MKKPGWNNLLFKAQPHKRGRPKGGSRNGFPTLEEFKDGIRRASERREGSRIAPDGSVDL